MAVVRVSRRVARVGALTFEMPKSSTLMIGVPSGRVDMKRFDGLRSR